MKQILIYIIGALMLSSCTKSLLAPGEYISWVEDESNGLNVSKEIAGQTFRLQYKPPGYEVLIHYPDSAINESEFAQMKKEIEGLQYFELTIISDDQKELAMSGLADENEYAERALYMMNDMQYDFALIDGKDTLPCVFFHAERNFNISPENHILLGFERPNAEGSNDKTLVYYDRILDCGPVMITIKAEDLENIPELKFAE